MTGQNVSCLSCLKMDVFISMLYAQSAQPCRVALQKEWVLQQPILPVLQAHRKPRKPNAQGMLASSPSPTAQLNTEIMKLCLHHSS